MATVFAYSLHEGRQDAGCHETVFQCGAAQSNVNHFSELVLVALCLRRSSSAGSVFCCWTIIQLSISSLQKTFWTTRFSLLTTANESRSNRALLVPISPALGHFELLALRRHIIRCCCALTSFQVGSILRSAHSLSPVLLPSFSQAIFQSLSLKLTMGSCAFKLRTVAY